MGDAPAPLGRVGPSSEQHHREAGLRPSLRRSADV